MVCQESRPRPRIGTPPKEDTSLLPPWWRGSSVTDPVVVFSCQVMSNSYVTLWIIAHQPPLSMGFPRQEYWSGLSFPSGGDIPDPGIGPAFLASLASAGRFFITAPPGSLCNRPSTLLMTGPPPPRVPSWGLSIAPPVTVDRFILKREDSCGWVHVQLPSLPPGHLLYGPSGRKTLTDMHRTDHLIHLITEDVLSTECLVVNSHMGHKYPDSLDYSEKSIQIPLSPNSTLISKSYSRPSRQNIRLCPTGIQELFLSSRTVICKSIHAFTLKTSKVWAIIFLMTQGSI